MDQTSDPATTTEYESPAPSSEFPSRPADAKSRNWTGKLMLGGILLGTVAAAFVAGPRLMEQFGSSKKDKYAHLMTDIAYKGPFLLTVNIQGNLDSQQNVTVNSSVEGTTTIISIVPEGTWVEKGEVVCVLDSSLMQDEADQQEIVVTNADAAAITAEKEWEVQKTQNLSDIAAADLQLKLADLDLEKYEEGEYNKLESELLGNLSLAEEEAVQAKETHEFNKQQVKKGNISQKELEASRIQMEKYNLAVIKAKEELKVLQLYDKKRTMAELNANAEEFVRELERVKLKAAAAEAQTRQAYEAARKSAELENSKWTKLKQQIKACTLIAPESGEVVYANLSGRRSRGSDGPAIEEGATVQERQAIFNLPDVSRMKVDARVHESLIGNIRIGLPAKVRVDARHDTTYRGEIAHVATVPTTGSWPNYDLREYPVSINITDDPEKVEKKLKPGLTAQVEVFVDSRDNVLQVPVTSVVGIVGKYYAFVLTPEGPQRRELQIGESNVTSIEIIDGVAEGERVILNPRTNFAEEIAELSGQLGDKTDLQDATENRVDGVPPGGATNGAPGGATPGNGSPFSGGGPSAGESGAQSDGNRPPGGAGGGRGNPGQMFATMDADKDGKLSGDEIPAPMKDRVSTMDTDSDGAISQEEMNAAMKRLRSGGKPGNPSEGAAGG